MFAVKSFPTASTARSCRPVISTRVNCVASEFRRTAKLFFSVPKKVHFGHSVGLVGSIDSIGRWDPHKGLTLTWHDNDRWSGEVEVPIGEHLEYKFFTRNSEGYVDEWQPCNNLLLDIPEKENAVVLVTDDWNGTERILSVQTDQLPAPVDERPAEPEDIFLAPLEEKLELQPEPQPSGIEGINTPADIQALSQFNGIPDLEHPGDVNGVIEFDGPTEINGAHTEINGKPEINGVSKVNGAYGVNGTNAAPIKMFFEVHENTFAPGSAPTSSNGNGNGSHAASSQAFEAVDEEAVEPEIVPAPQAEHEEEESAAATPLTQPTSSLIQHSAEDLAQLTVKELKAMLKKLDLPQNGKKADLISRLTSGQQ